MPKSLGLAKTKTVTDIPVNREHQKWIGQLQKEAVALEVMLTTLNKWISPKSAEAIKESIVSLGACIYADICRLSTEKYKETEHPL